MRYKIMTKINCQIHFLSLCHNYDFLSDNDDNILLYRLFISSF